MLLGLQSLHPRLSESIYQHKGKNIIMRKRLLTCLYKQISFRHLNKLLGLYLLYCTNQTINI